MNFLFSELVLGADHAGVQLKKALLEKLEDYPHLSCIDKGVFDEKTSVDYPDVVKGVVKSVEHQTAGVLICGSGIGVAIAANRYPSIRAVLCHEPLTARLSRQHNDANVIVFGERLVGIDMAFECLMTFLRTPFEGGRHLRRVEKLRFSGGNF